MFLRGSRGPSVLSLRRWRASRESNWVIAVELCVIDRCPFCPGEITTACFKSSIGRDPLFTRGKATEEDCFSGYCDIDLRDDEWKASIDRYRDNRFAF